MTRPWLKAALAAAVVVAVGLGVYLIYLDRLITSTFEGRRWSVPAQVYAQPVELYPGATLSLANITEELTRLGYRADANLRAPGSYARRDRGLKVYLRAFDFLEGQRPSQRISIDFQGGGIRSIADGTGRPIPLIRLDPLTIGSFFPSHGEDRQILAPDDVPPLLTETLKAVEDTKFDRHPGFDLTGIGRAAWVNLTAGEIRQGGSTLTQQLVKSYYLDNRRTLGRKLKEVLMAVILEVRFSKQELLNAYVNEIFLGQDGGRAVHGFGLGAQFYFNKPLKELEVHELATLVAIIRGPSFYNPYRHAQRTHDRRDLVLNKMASAELIDQPTLEASLKQPFEVVRGARSGGAYYPAFMDVVRATLHDSYPDEVLTTEGLRVFTTLSPRAQDAVESALTTTIGQLETQRQLPPGELQGAVIVANTQTGEIEAISGGRAAGFDGFNRAANARRPVGSLLKPVVYLAALERGYHLASPIQDAPVELPLQGSGTWTPANFDGKVHGPVPLVRALGDSLNLATVNLGLSIGVDQVAERLTTLTDRQPDNRYPSLLLGAESLTPLDVLALYTTFASGGFHMTPKSVTAVADESGATLTRHHFALDQRIELKHAETLGRGLEAVMRLGTGKSSRFSKLGVAGKTGTSDDYRDSWFVGYDSRRIAVVWLGFDDNRPTGMTGAAGALKVWDSIFTRLGIAPLPQAGDHWREIEYDTGLVANADCAEVIALPLPIDAQLDAKPGCGISLKRVADGIGRRLREWFD